MLGGAAIVAQAHQRTPAEVSKQDGCQVSLDNCLKQVDVQGLLGNSVVLAWRAQDGSFPVSSDLVVEEK